MQEILHNIIDRVKGAEGGRRNWLLVMMNCSSPPDIVLQWVPIFPTYPLLVAGTSLRGCRQDCPGAGADEWPGSPDISNKVL